MEVIRSGPAGSKRASIFLTRQAVLVTAWRALILNDEPMKGKAMNGHLITRQPRNPFFILLIGLIMTGTLGGCVRGDIREVSDLYEMDTNRYRLEAKIEVGHYQYRQYGEERKLLYAKAKGHCEKDGKSLKVYSLGQQTLGTAGGGFAMGIQGMAYGAASSAPVTDAMIIEFGCVERTTPAATKAAP